MRIIINNFMMLSRNVVKTRHRITKQRKLILDELKKVSSHPTAFEVYKTVKKKMPQIGLATVYRNLAFLEKNHFIIKLQSKHRESRYDGYPGSHLHLICKNCDKVFDIHDCTNISIKSKELNKIGFVVVFDYLEVHGYCKKCNSHKKI